MRTLKLECDCGFFIGSHDEGEITEMSLVHMRKKHGQTVSAEYVKQKIKAV
jgi:predicted small metal-binding protein